MLKKTVLALAVATPFALASHTALADHQTQAVNGQKAQSQLAADAMRRGDTQAMKAHLEAMGVDVNQLQETADMLTDEPAQIDQAATDLAQTEAVAVEVQTKEKKKGWFKRKPKADSIAEDDGLEGVAITEQPKKLTKRQQRQIQKALKEKSRDGVTLPQAVDVEYDARIGSPMLPGEFERRQRRYSQMLFEQAAMTLDREARIELLRESAKHGNKAAAVELQFQQRGR